MKLVAMGVAQIWAVHGQQPAGGSQPACPNAVRGSSMPCNQLAGLHQSRSHQNNIGPCRNPWRTIEHVRGAVIIATTGLWDPGGNGLKLKVGFAQLRCSTAAGPHFGCPAAHKHPAAPGGSGPYPHLQEELGLVCTGMGGLHEPGDRLVVDVHPARLCGEAAAGDGRVSASGGGGTGGEEKLVGGRARCDLVMHQLQRITSTALAGKRARLGAERPERERCAAPGRPCSLPITCDRRSGVAGRVAGLPEPPSRRPGTCAAVRGGRLIQRGDRALKWCGQWRTASERHCSRRRRCACFGRWEPSRSR